MLFITNRRVEGGRRSQPGRTLSFAAADPEPGVSLYFCERQAAERYVELTAMPFFGRLRRSPRQQVLFFLHGFNCQPETQAFPAAERLQALADALAPGLIEVVPVIWPCEDDFGLVLDYWDDQGNADVSGMALARLLGKFMTWRERLGTEETCLKHINVLAHSMGNRVLATALAAWAHDYGTVLADAARHVVVYHAADDLALRSSKIANVRHKLVRRRLGHTGPADLEQAPRNVVAVDCDEFNSGYDRFGHSYYLADPQGRPGALLAHAVATIRTGRVAGLLGDQRRLTLTAETGLIMPPPANTDRPAERSA